MNGWRGGLVYCPGTAPYDVIVTLLYTEYVCLLAIESVSNDLLSHFNNICSCSAPYEQFREKEEIGKSKGTIFVTLCLLSTCECKYFVNAIIDQ